MILVPDARRRVTLPARFKAGQSVQIEVLEDGTYLLVPMVAIPKNQLRAWRSGGQASVKASLAKHHDEKSLPLDDAKSASFQRKLTKT